jgi:predicted kinase
VLISPQESQLVLVSGPPAAGKTTLAGPLAAQLGFPLLAKDRIKEALHDSLGDGPSGKLDLTWSRRLGAASMELLWTLAADAPAVVLEANFWPDDPRVRCRVAELAARPVEVYCDCPAEVYLRRYAARGTTRHPVHLDDQRTVTAEAFARWNRPMGIGPVIVVDTTRPVDITALAQEVRAQLA